jgi:hypothetical protein
LSSYATNRDKYPRPTEGNDDNGDSDIDAEETSDEEYANYANEELFVPLMRMFQSAGWL